MRVFMRATYLPFPSPFFRPPPLRFQRVVVLNCPGLVAPLTALRGLSGLTHLELGGGCAPDGWEHGYARPGYGAGMTAEDLQRRSDAHEDGANLGSSSSCCSGLGCLACSDNSSSSSPSSSNGSRSESSKRRDFAPSGFEALGHEFRIPMKGVTGRLGSLACHRHLVREMSLFFATVQGVLQPRKMNIY